MIVRIYWGRVASGAWPSIEEKYRELNRLKAPGLLARLVTQDANDVESMYTITVWEDLASVEAWESSSDYENVFSAAINRFIVGSRSISLCEVKVANLAGLLDWSTKSGRSDTSLSTS